MEFFTQSEFDRWATQRNRRMLACSVAIAALFLAAILFLSAVLLAKISSEGRLLLRGADTVATVRTAHLTEQSRTRLGRPQLYHLVVTYEFEAQDAQRYEGTARRSDLSAPIRFTAGQSIKIYYDPSDPRVSTINHSLRSDVYGAALFLPFLLVPGVMITFFLYRYALWRRRLA